MQLQLFLLVLCFGGVFGGGCPDRCSGAVCKPYPNAKCYNSHEGRCNRVFMVESEFIVECNQFCSYTSDSGELKHLPVLSTLTYKLTCPPGTKVVGDENRVCLEHQVWSGDKPRCEMTAIDSARCDQVCPINPCRTATCPASNTAECYCDDCKPVFMNAGNPVECHDFCTVPRPEGTTSDSNLRTIPVGAVLEYTVTCRPGMRMIGKTKMTCVAPDTWDGDFPTCEKIPKYCNRPKKFIPRNGRKEMAEGPVYIGTTMKFICNPGYKIAGGGTDTVTCTATRKWSSKLPRCIPMCKNLRKCLVDPCKDAQCRGVPAAQCRPNYCGKCSAEWFVGSTKLTDKECENPLCRRLCPKNTCDHYVCRRHAVFQCVPDTCFMCKPMFYNKFGARISSDLCTRKCPKCTKTSCVCDRYPNSATCTITDDCGTCLKSYRSASGGVLSDMQCMRDCPGGMKMDCAENPCIGATCPDHPDAVCVVNRCGQCTAEFYVDDMKVQCQGSCPTALTQCDDPCDGATCRGRPGAICKPNYCGGCKAEWFYEDKKVTDKECEMPMCRAFCGEPRCREYGCEGYNKIQCVADTCNQCNLLFYDEFGSRIKSSCVNIGLCGMCVNNPCEDTSTRCKHPGATCTVSSCFGCKAVWSDADGNQLTDKQCQVPLCRVRCPESSCDILKCKDAQNVQCVPNSCSGCAPMYYDSKGKRLPDSTCEKKSCEFDDSGGTKQRVPVGEFLQYSITCPEGTEISGPLKVQCIDHNTWSEGQPTCKAIPATDCSECPSNPCTGRTCAALPSVECKCIKCKAVFPRHSGFVDCDNFCSYTGGDGTMKTIPVGGVVQYQKSCPSGQSIVGNLKVVCLSHETWDQEEPYCA